MATWPLSPRHAAVFRPAFKRAFRLRVPVFRDESLTLEHSAVASFFLAALELAARGISTERVLRLFENRAVQPFTGRHCPFGKLSLYLAAEGGRLARPPLKKPCGFGAQPSPQQAQELARTEALRAGIMEKLGAFLQSGAAPRRRAFPARCIFCWIPLAVQRARRRWPPSLPPRATHRAPRLCNDAVEPCDAAFGRDGKLLGGRDVPGEYAELFALLLQVAARWAACRKPRRRPFLPQADRMRLSGPRVCFVLGLSEGEFPRAAGASGLLTHTDRELWCAAGADARQL